MSEKEIQESIKRFEEYKEKRIERWEIALSIIVPIVVATPTSIILGYLLTR